MDTPGASRCAVDLPRRCGGCGNGGLHGNPSRISPGGRPRVRCQAENGATNAASGSAATSSRWDSVGRMAASGAQDRQASSPPTSQQGSQPQDPSASRGPSGLPPAASRAVLRGQGTLPAAGGPSPSSPPRPTFDDLMAFDGIPEIVNGRLAMLGFVSGAVVELREGVSFLDQVFDPSQFGLFYGGVAVGLVTAASVIPLLRGSSPAAAGFLFFHEDAERTNGRLAMLGLLGVFVVEYIASFLLQQ